jgi:hypothetical protein
MFRTSALVGSEKDQGGEGKVIDEATDQGPGHFGVVRLEVAQIFNKNRTNDDVAYVEDNQQILQAFRITLVEK